MLGRINKIAFSIFTKKDGFKIEKFKELIIAAKECGKNEKIKRIEQVMTYDPLTKHYSSGGFHIVSEHSVFEYEEKELHTARKLADVGFHVVFVPKGYFDRWQKRFDVFLFKKHIVLEADLKCINSDNPDTIGNRIKEGSAQANRVVLDIHCSISKNKLIEALRTGCARNGNLVEILLLYNDYCIMVNSMNFRKIK